ncbi:protein crumbs homolog 1 isoform X2 [Pelobates fuscus]|uniref:protein crumbs homolog 1 isoform X2 n=1 Tax=Pelobates fuscus TaxID=191477 RepID=UPI002FE44891
MDTFRPPAILRICLCVLMVLHDRRSLCVGKPVHCPVLPCTVDLPCELEGNCSETIDPCISHPCPWNATCQVSTIAHTKECRCPTGYAGKFCEIPMERCSRNMCGNGGDCYVGEEGPTCFCTMGYKGTFCETPEDECLWNPCKNGAVCRLKEKRQACYCVPGYQGPLCDIEVDECVSQPCQHGATCLNQIGQYKCVCPREYTGRDCELEFNGCSLGPCLNGATCHSSGLSFSCSCPSNFYGDSCEFNVDECASYPCLNGGQCLDEINGYTCDCSMVGFIGVHCETPIELCSSQSCQNNASCVEASGTFLCLCQKGVHCEEDLNECESNPCQNGGTCENTHGSYICHCKPSGDTSPKYYGGRDCNELLIGCEGQICQNGGSCMPQFIDGTHSFTCLCLPGFTDPHCRTLTTFSFNGKSIFPVENIIYPSDGRYVSNVSLSFQTVQPSAFILHLGNSTSFFRLYIQDGKMFLAAYVNSQMKTLLSLPHKVSDDQWHSIEIIFTEILTLKLLDISCTEKCMNSSSRYINSSTNGFVFQKMFLGGDISTLEADFGKVVLEQPWFVGCIRDVRVDSTVVTAEVSTFSNVVIGCKRRDHCESNPCQNRGECVNQWLNYHCDCFRPYKGSNCSSEYESARFGLGKLTSYAIFPVTINWSDNITISVFVRTRQPYGILLAFWNSSSYDIVMSLEGGRVIVKTSNYFIMKGESIINDGNFHLVSLEVTQSTMELFVSSQSQDYISLDTPRLPDLSVLYVGGLENASETSHRGGYFKGCLQDLRIQGIKIGFFSSSEFYNRKGILRNVTVGCASVNLCEPNPCQNGGVCYSTWDDFTCTCPPNTAGKACEELEWCQIAQCPPGALCQPVNGGYECHAKAFFSGISHGLTYRSNGMIVRHLTNLTLGFRTRCSESVLLHAEKEPEVITISIQNSQLVFDLQSGNNVYAVSLSSKQSVSNNQWHDVTFSMTEPGSQSSRWMMEIDDKTDKIVSSAATGNLNFLKDGTDIYLGEHHNSLIKNFSGCLSTVAIGGIHLPYFEDKDYHIAKPQREQFVKISEANVSTGCLSYNPCASHPCMNGGTCHDFYTQLVCNCPAGKTGTFCEIDIDKCLSNPCLHGNCTDGAGGYVCECHAGYTGINCDINICNGRLCPNGATCFESPSGFVCLCPPNVTGQFCRYHKLPSTFCGNEKKNTTCYNYGNCTVEGGEPRCTCLPGFVGERCEVDVDECESDPCLNGGLCQNLPNRFHCICDVNFAGDRCEIDQPDSYPPGVFTAVASVVLAFFFAVCAGVCIFIIVSGMRSNQGTYSPSRQEKEGSRVEMWNIVQPPPVERLI